MASSLVPKPTLLISPKTNLNKPCVAIWPTGRGLQLRVVRMASSPSTPPNISESIKKAEETCAESKPESGECAAAWDEVEELSAAASHARDKLKGSDPLDSYCKDNPQSSECRTDDN